MNASYIRFENLKPDTEYAARFRTLINGTAISLKDIILINKTLNTREPYPVDEIQVSFPETKNSSFEAKLTWKPSNGMHENNIIRLYLVIYLCHSL